MERMKTWLLAAVVAWTGFGPAGHAAVVETPQLRILGVDHGLPSSNVNGLAFDRSGYLWIATTDGLARFDGVGMRVWRHRPGDATSLPGNFVETVHVDEQNRVWAAVEGRGLSMLGADREGFIHYRKSTHPQVASDDVFALASRGQDVWFGTFGGGLHRLGSDGRIRRYTKVDGDPASLPSETVVTLAFDGRGRLWIATLNGLARWDGRVIERIALPGPLPTAMVYSLAVENDALWVGTTTGVYRLESNGRWHVPDWSTMFEKPNAVLSMAPEGAGRYWLATQRGIWRIDASSVPVPVPLQSRGPRRSVVQILRQPGGALWLPVSGAGIGYLRPDWQRLAQPAGTAGASYRNVAPSRDGGVWLTQGQGAVERLAPLGEIEALPPLLARQLDGRMWLSVTEDPQGRLWLGNGSTLVRVSRDGTVREWPVTAPADATLGTPIDLLRVAPDGTLWMSCAGAGLQQRDLASGRVLRTIPAGPDHGLGVGDLEALDFDPDGRLWVAGADGVAQLGGPGRLRAVPGIATNERVFAFDFDGRDTVWLQRLAGLERYRRSASGWRLDARVGVAQGMPGVEASGLRVDGSGRVWVSTQRGLLRWDPHRRRMQVFGIEDGLSSQEFNDRALVLTADGVLTATLADGRIVQIDTQAPDPVALPHPLHVDRIEARRGGQWQPLDAVAPQLEPDDRELRVQLRLLAFESFRANRYWTRLDGYDRGWIEHSGSDPGERVFAGLAPGRYTLHMRAMDAAGQVSTARSVTLTVHAPWWRTTWALAGLAVLVFALIFLAFRLQRQRLQRRAAWERAERERELAHEASLAKSRFLATLGHEVRTPMTGVLGMSELLLDTPLTAQQRGYTDAIRGAGEHLLRLVNDALDLARIEAGKLHLVEEVFDLHALLRDVGALMGPLAQRRGLAFHLDIADGTPHEVLGDASRVRQVLLNLLGNAVKFTGSGEVRLHAQPCETGVRLSVSDTGPGLSEEHKARLFQRFEQGDGARTTTRFGGSGLGLAICQELAAAMGGAITVDSATGRGTRFDVDLPLHAFEGQGDAGVDAAEVIGAAAVVPVHVALMRPREHCRLRVLLVEDDVTVADVVAGLLRMQGHEVMHVGHGLAALAQIATASYDLALLDLDLPGMDGFALARHLRGLGFDLPLAALTARADADAEAQAHAAGFDRFLRKPVTGAGLADAIRELVRETP